MNRIQACSKVGQGWYGMVDKYFDFVNRIGSEIEVEVVEARLGMLYISAYSDDSITQEMLNKLANAIERDSVRVCEVCGGKGFRRKALPGLPNRCRTHYIELTNEMAESGEIEV